MEPQTYVKGLPLDLSFGGESQGTDRVRVCLYGDVDSPAAPFIGDATTAECPDQAGLSDHQKLRFWFEFRRVRPYGDVAAMVDHVVGLLKQGGWQPAEPEGNFPDTGNTVDGLVDTTDIGYRGYGRDFPATPNSNGFNAAGGLSVVVEKTGTKPEYSNDEIEAVISLVDELSQVVFRLLRRLPMVGLLCLTSEPQQPVEIPPSQGGEEVK